MFTRLIRSTIFLLCSSSTIGSVQQHKDIPPFPNSPSGDDAWVESLKHMAGSSAAGVSIDALLRLKQTLDSAIIEERYTLVDDILLEIIEVSENLEHTKDLSNELNRAFESTPNSFVLERGRIVNFIGREHAHKREIQDAMASYNLSIKLIASSNHPSEMTYAMANIAELFQAEGAYKEALQCSIRALPHSQSLEEPERTYRLIFDTCRIGALHGELGDDERAVEYFENAIELANGLNVPNVSIRPYVAILEFYLDRSQVDLARPYAESAELDYKPHLNPLNSLNLDLQLARYDLKLGRISQAERRLPPDLSRIKTKRDALLKIRGDIALARGDFESAHQWTNLRLRETLAGYEEARRRSVLNIDSHLDSDALKASDVTDKEARASRRDRYLIVALCVCSIIIVFVFLRLDSRRRKEKRLRKRESIVNQRLSELVEEKTAELVTQMEEQAVLERQLERKRRTEALGALTGGVAHDINNVLQVLLTANEIIEMEPDRLSHSQKSMIATSAESIQTASDIVRQLLSFARRQHLTPQILEVGELLSAKRELLQTVIGDRNSLEIKIECPDACIRIDSAQFTSSLINLLTNAAHAMRDGGSIRVSVERLRLENSNLCYALGSGDYIQLSVQDQGCGMTEDEVARCCEPFYSTKDHAEGTGLGLSTVQGFVKQSGGELRIDSTPDVGTTVTLVFPVAEPSSQGIQAATLPPRDAYRRLRVLLVEDNAQVRVALSSKLKSIGLTVEVTQSADEAITALTNDSGFDLVLSDIQMPGTMDGRDLKDWVTSNLSGTLVLLMTGYAELDQTQQNIHILRKPFSDEQLMEKIAELSCLL